MGRSNYTHCPALWEAQTTHTAHLYGKLKLHAVTNTKSESVVKSTKKKTRCIIDYILHTSVPQADFLTPLVPRISFYVEHDANPCQVTSHPGFPSWLLNESTHHCFQVFLLARIFTFSKKTALILVPRLHIRKSLICLRVTFF